MIKSLSLFLISLLLLTSSYGQSKQDRKLTKRLNELIPKRLREIAPGCVVLFSMLLMFLSSNCFSQTYISLAPSLTNSAGTIADKSNIALELGQQWDVFSMGLDYGKTTLSPVTGRDTTGYFELRPNLNIFQEGKFTNTFTAGIGYVINAKENLLTEVTYGIEYSFTEKLHLNVFFGQYYYSGKQSASNVSFFGVSAAFYFSPNTSGPLIKQKSK